MPDDTARNQFVRRVTAILREYASEHGNMEAANLLLEVIEERELQNLKPCPFCGSKDAAVADGGTFVMCSGCSTGGPLAHDEKSARQAWNNRNRSVY